MRTGTAGESSSFKHGFFEKTVRWIEIVLPNGEVVTASPTERPDLFSGAAGTFGTLGVITLLELNLIDSRRYVEMTYHPTSSTVEALTTMRLASEIESNDYIDGILYSPSHGAIVSGRLTDDHAPGTKLQHFSRAQDPWFYIHAERITRHAVEPVKEITPVRDYLFRYDRGAFWTGRYAFSYFLTPFNRVTRYMLDYFMHTRVMYHALHASGHASRYMIQDLLLPSDGVQAFIDYVDKDFGIWPLWLCPIKVDGEISLHPRMPNRSSDSDKTSTTFINVGVWGPGSANYDKFIDMNRRLERKVRELGGLKWLYAQAYYTEAEFDGIYDRKWYDNLREKYHATYLPTVYEKVKVDLSRYQAGQATWSAWLHGTAWSIWPLSGLYGVWTTLWDREYLLAK